MEKKRNSFIIPLYCFGIIAVFAAVLIIPAARAWFEGATAAHPFIMGFFKFAFLALSGELIALRIKGKRWSLPSYVIARFALWGLIGVWITFMMKVFSSGIGSLIEKKHNYRKRQQIPQGAFYERNNEPDIRPHLYGRT